MRAGCWPGPRGWLLLAAAVLAGSGLTAGCGSSKPAYCAAAASLKTSVSDLGHVDVAQNGLASLQAAVNSVASNAATFAADAKAAYPSQTTALKNSLSGLASAIKSAKGQPTTTAVAAVASAVTQVKTSATSLQSGVSGKCQ
jgi:hypothetical protein